MSRRRFMRDKNLWSELSVGDIVYDKQKNPIGVVAYRFSGRIGVMALNRKTQISTFGTDSIINGVSNRDYRGTGSLDQDIHLMPQDDFSGEQNTSLVVNKAGNSSVYGARYCKEYKLGGYDWYLPAVSEIRQMWMSKGLINAALNSLGIQNWEIRQFTGGKDIELIVSSTYISNSNTLHCIRLNENGKIGYWMCSSLSSKETWSGGYPAYFSVYPFFSIKID